ncbi:PHB depolymerase family esterase [Pseudoroseomonas globiformis]|uniref:PHB depolymerase family esterase n=1 Tax=Teichococcus globiformis TaxID=2307229 RepID=A0ABV7G4W7_9PROT
MTETSPGLDELVRLRQRWSRFVGRAHAPSPAERAAAEEARRRLTEITEFGSNPGQLRLLCYLPPDLPPGAPLVLALHGCTQNAASFDLGCGWSFMADRLGFALLLPEQRRENNPNLCFNWFNPEDARRNSGEAASIRQMIEWMQTTHGTDPTRVFIGGLSAGGAMSSVMLACYPECFSGGAIIAGLPYGAAQGVPGAFDAMHRPAKLPARQRGDAVRTASDHGGPWPRISVWQGGADVTVKPGNAAEILKQWLDLHGLAIEHPAVEQATDLGRYRLWRDAGGNGIVECHEIAALDHGVPLHAGEDEGQAGRAGPFLLEAGISSTHEILRFWGLGTDRADERRRFVVDAGGDAREVTPRRFGLLDRALRAAGLR